jgi:hypothetical protein
VLRPGVAVRLGAEFRPAANAAALSKTTSAMAATTGAHSRPPRVSTACVATKARPPPPSLGLTWDHPHEAKASQRSGRARSRSIPTTSRPRLPILPEVDQRLGELPRPPGDIRGTSRSRSSRLSAVIDAGWARGPDAQHPGFSSWTRGRLE